MNCMVLTGGGAPARWKRECIELLRARNDVEIAPDDRQPPAADVILDLRTASIASGAPARGERWYFCDGEGRALGRFPGAAEIASGSRTFTIQLRARRSDGRDAVLRSGRFKALYSYRRSMKVALRECVRWPSICLALPNTEHRIVDPPASQSAPRFSMLKLMTRQIGLFTAHVYRHLFEDTKWRVGVIRDAPASFLAQHYRPDVEWISPEGEFFADPFVLHSNGRAIILGETLDAATRNGFIAGIAVDTRGHIVERRTVLRTGTHLSYPYVFKDGDDWYMVPESAAERRIVLHRAIEFPFSWTRVGTLIDGIAACDSTIFRHQGRWWLYCTDRSRDANLNLFLYYADVLTGPWTAHPANPVKTDIASARPAGMPFVVNGSLYRPAQDCAASYGSSIVFHRVVKLSETEYEEEAVSRSASGVHTISYADGIVAIDSKSDVVAPPGLVARRLSGLVLRVFGAGHAR
jgi:hypothetical protein